MLGFARTCGASWAAPRVSSRRFHSWVGRRGQCCSMRYEQVFESARRAAMSAASAGLAAIERPPELGHLRARGSENELGGCTASDRPGGLRPCESRRVLESAPAPGIGGAATGVVAPRPQSPACKVWPQRHTPRLHRDLPTLDTVRDDLWTSSAVRSKERARWTLPQLRWERI
jgi:hypothetical protein